MVNASSASVGNKRNVPCKVLRIHSHSKRTRPLHSLSLFLILCSPLSDLWLLMLTDPLARPLFKCLPAVNYVSTNRPHRAIRDTPSACPHTLHHTYYTYGVLVLVIWDKFLFVHLLFKARQVELKCARVTSRHHPWGRARVRGSDPLTGTTALSLKTWWPPATLPSQKSSGFQSQNHSPR